MATEEGKLHMDVFKFTMISSLWKASFIMADLFLASLWYCMYVCLQSI